MVYTSTNAIFRMVIESRERGDGDRKSIEGAVKVSMLNLVDLAGSERIAHTGLLRVFKYAISNVSFRG